MLVHSINHIYRRVLVLAVSVAVLVGIPRLAQALDQISSQSGWLGNTTLEVNRVADLLSGQTIPFSINGNRDCQNRQIITRPSRPPFQVAITSSECAVDTAFGAVAPNGLLQRPGTTVWGPVKQTSGANATIIPIPRSNTGIQFTSGPANSLYLNFTEEIDTSLRTSTDILGQLTHSINKPPTASLKDKSGQLLMAVTDSLAFSANSKWMVVDIRSLGMVRVNLETYEVLPFADPFNYDIGLAPGIQSAISSDGRFAVIAATGFNRFIIYDLSTCGAVPDHPTQKVLCQSRDLFPIAQQQITSLVGISTVRFINDNVFSFYARRKDSATSSILSQYTFGLPGASVPKLDYLALGDSFTSGEGAYQYKASTDTKDNLCHLSQRSYPYLIGAKQSLGRYESVACSGAKINDIGDLATTYKPQASGKTASSFDNEILSGFLPGYRAQNSFISQYQPAAITISVVGNDAGMPAHLKHCLQPGTCYASYEDHLELLREINSQYSRLTRLFSDVRQLSGPKTKIYAVGYPELFQPGGNCALNVRIDAQEAELLNKLINQLNIVIQQAASSTGLGYIDVSDAFNGHRLCETASSKVAVNGLTFGNDIPAFSDGPLGNESYHPNSLGQQLLADTILQQTINFGQNMPLPVPSLTGPVENSSSPLLQAPKTNRQIDSLAYDSELAAPIIYRERVTQVTVNTKNMSLQPNSLMKMSLNDGQIDLGTAFTSTSGNYSVPVNIPENILPGFYILSVKGKNSGSDPIKIYVSVYVAVFPTDYDGDGQPNDSDSCIGSLAAGIDEDLDNIDDSCDAFIDSNPLQSLLYRVRTGEVSRGESSTYIFLERNVALSKKAFNIADYDADEDGWAVVAKSNSPANSGQFATYFMTLNNTQSVAGPYYYVPKIGVKTANRGCVQLTPEHLSAVTKNQKRPFKIEIENSVVCRDISIADHDHDGTADSSQALYRLRVSTGEHGEQAERIFIERNTYASQAQLSISDFSKYSDGWAIVGSTKKPLLHPVKALVLIDPQTNEIIKRVPLPPGAKTVTLGVNDFPESTWANMEPAVLIEEANRKCRVITPTRLAFVRKLQPGYMKKVPHLRGVPCQ